MNVNFKILIFLYQLLITQKQFLQNHINICYYDSDNCYFFTSQLIHKLAMKYYHATIIEHYTFTFPC